MTNLPTKIRDEWLHWILSVELAEHYVCRPVAELYARRLAGDEPTQDEWREAEQAAEAAWAAAAADAAEAAWAEAAWAAAAAARVATTAEARQRITQALVDACARNGVDLVVPDLHSRVCAAVDADPSALDMGTWHCDTSHCRAGWAITISPVGLALESLVGSEYAGAAIYLASTGAIPDFYATDEDALADIRRCAEVANG